VAAALGSGVHGGEFIYKAAYRWNNKSYWNIILTPNYNSAHDNHFHIDLTPNANYIKAKGYFGVAPLRLDPPSILEVPQCVH
jgi:hypothetical protein